jgi:hypothetical protein
MVEQIATRFRALLGGRGEDPVAGDEQDDDDLDGVPGPDPEWDELLAWARESEDEPEWEAVIARAKQVAAVQVTAAVPATATVPVTAGVQVTDEAEEWGRLLALAKAIPSDPRPTPAARPAPAAGPAPAARPAPAAIPRPWPPAGSIASLSARLERMSAQVPDARRRRAR